MRITWKAASEELVPVGSGLVMPAVVTVRAVGSEVAPDVEVDLIVENGRLVVRELRMWPGENGLPITTESIRHVRVAYLVQHAVHTVSSAEDAGKTTPRKWPVFSQTDLNYVSEHGMTDRTLRLVADVYRLGLLTGQHPTKMVEAWLEQPRSTVGRWIAAAREKGFLGESEGPGRAGEVGR